MITNSNEWQRNFASINLCYYIIIMMKMTVPYLRRAVNIALVDLKGIDGRE